MLDWGGGSNRADDGEEQTRNELQLDEGRECRRDSRGGMDDMQRRAEAVEPIGHRMRSAMGTASAGPAGALGLAGELAPEDSGKARDCPRRRRREVGGLWSVRERTPGISAGCGRLRVRASRAGMGRE